MGATVVPVNLKIKFDVFIEIQGRSTRAASSCRRRIYTCNYSRRWERASGGLIAQLRMMDLNSNVTVRRM